MEWKLCPCISTSSKHDFKSLTLRVLQDQNLLICQNWYYLLYSQVPFFLTLKIRRLKGFLLLSLSMAGGALFHWLPVTILSSRLAAPGSPGRSKRNHCELIITTLGICLNPFSTKSDQYQVSPDNFNTFLRKKVQRIYKIITKEEMFLSFIKIS